MIKSLYIYLVIAIVIAGGVIFWVSRDDKGGVAVDTLSSASPSPTLNSFPVPTSTPLPTPKLIKSTPKPSPKIIVTEVNQYQSLVDWLEPLNRRLTLDENCTSVVPSQLAYPNNTQIMLDNTLSASPRVLKIGAKEYSLAANGWLLVTLSSTKLPASLTMFCGPMELGQLDLE